LDALTGIVLCGGRGQRVGGADKPLMSWRGQPVIETVINRLSPQVTAVIISANRNTSTYRRYGHPVVTDAILGFQGPLAGIATGLANATTPGVVACAGDAPHLPLDIVARLSAARSPVELAAVGHDGAHLQPLPILLKREALPSITEFLAGGGRAIRKWLATVPHRVVDMPELAGCFDSLNLPEDFD
jgi:molybdopterin-guanine dinucleotide biosynthesis protein A